MARKRCVQVEVRGLSVEYAGGVQALRNVSFDIHAGELLGIVGESGCGKTTLGGALVGDVPGSGKMTSGSVVLNGPNGDTALALDLVTALESERRDLWGRRIAMVFQDPYAALNPGFTVGDQIDEAVRRRPTLVETSVRDRTLALLEQVHMPAPSQIARRYPHQLSGGQQQRAVIAMALAANPDLLILDEPTTGLDVTTEACILDLILELKETVNASIVFITHNLAVIAQIADQVAVMYAGEIVEIGTVHDVFHRPTAPYTAGLLSCIPRTDHKAGAKEYLRTIPGVVPAPTELPEGCTFAPRCPFAQARCWVEPPPLLDTPEEGHLARCFFIDEVRRAGWPEGRRIEETAAIRETTDTPILVGRHLSKTYGRDLRRYWIAGPMVRRAALAIKDVSFELRPGETLGIVGESGCGKTTLVNCISGLISATRGSVMLEGEELAASVADRPRGILWRMQMVFQNPDLSLNPQYTVGEILNRAVRVLSANGGERERSARVAALLARVGLGEHYLSRRPSELSGGEKQRVAVAHALAGNPDVVLGDEITSSLDVSVRAAILNLLNDLQIQQGVAYLFISHDMSAIRHVSDRVMVLYLGMVMEVGSVDAVFEPPYHPYTEALMSAIPVPDPDVKSTPIRLEGTVPSADRRPSGCPFHTRCPRLIGPICKEESPPWQDAGNGHHIYCHIPLEELQAEQASLRPVAKSPRREHQDQREHLNRNLRFRA